MIIETDDCLPALRGLLKMTPPMRCDLIYIDPPFNTGRTQTGASGASYEDSIGENYVEWLIRRVEVGCDLLSPTGSIFIHLDSREVHYVKVALDGSLNRNCFMNEIIWAYDYGGRPKNRWPAKHDTILWYAMNPDDYTFNYDEMDRIPYMAPGLVGPEKAARGKTPTDVWWHTIVPTNGKERCGYPTQKPLGIVERIVKIHSNPGDVCLDFFAGSGTLGVAAKNLGREYICIDNNPEAIAAMRSRGLV